MIPSNYNKPYLEDYGLDYCIYEKIYEINIKIEDIRKVENVKFKIIRKLLYFFVAICFVLFFFILSLLDFNDKDALHLISLLNFCFSYLAISYISDNVNFKTNDAYEKLYKDRSILNEKLKPFEEDLYKYYVNTFQDFKKNNLYRKKSSSPGFIDALCKFSDSLNELQNVKFHTKRMVSWIYRNNIGYTHYIYNCDIIANLKSYVWDRFEKINNPKVNIRKLNSTKSINPKPNLISSHSREMTTSPEIRFKSPKKINWVKKIEENIKTGYEGECIVVELEKEYFNSIGEFDLANKVKHVSKDEGDGLGYDVLSFFKDGRQKYIEVKSTKSDISAPFYISENEFSFLKEHKKNSLVYRVSVGNDSSDELLFKVYTVDEILDSNITPEEYKVIF